MFPHPDTICVLAAIEHREALAGAVRARLAAQPRPGVDRRPSLAAEARRRLGVALIGPRRRRLDSARPVAVDVTAAGAVR